MTLQSFITAILLVIEPRQGYQPDNHCQVYRRLDSISATITILLTDNKLLPFLDSSDELFNTLMRARQCRAPTRDDIIPKKNRYSQTKPSFSWNSKTSVYTVAPKRREALIFSPTLVGKGLGNTA
jgi:hypothetical protein